MPSPFDFINRISLSTESVASFIFFLTAASVAVVSMVLFFHWRRYGMGSAILAVAELVYLGVSAVLLGAAFFSLG